MAIKTTISWTDHTFNIAWGCTKVSPGCKNCYADALSHRYGHDVWGPGKPRRTFGEKHWHEPLQWNSQAQNERVRHRVFCSSMCDVFEDHPTIDGEREKLWSLIRSTPWLDWQLLTKRPERIQSALPANWGDGFENVWIGTSIESNDYISRADFLRAIPATVRFISYEPALGPLDQLDLTGLDWLIYGGESGGRFRADDTQWARAIRLRCETAGTAFFYKQSAGRFPGRGEIVEGEQVKNYPHRRIPLMVLSQLVEDDRRKEESHV